MLVTTINDSTGLVCKIELTKLETEAIRHCLVRTHAKGAQLTVSMQLEEFLTQVLKDN